MQQCAISVLVVVMMVAIGLRTNLRDFAVVFTRWRPLVVALIVNLVAVPLVALLALSWAALPEAAIVGVMLCAASPGGPAGPLFAIQARGHIATSVAAMSMLALMSALTAPLTITWTLGMAVAVDANHLLLPMTRTLFIFQMLPLVAGMAVRRWRPVWADRFSGPANQVANGLLLVVILGLLVSKGHLLLQLGTVGLVLCNVLVLVNLGMGAIVSRRGPEQRSYAMVTGVRNISLALLLSATYFPAPLTDVAILTFGLFTMVIPFVAARIVGAITKI